MATASGTAGPEDNPSGTGGREDNCQVAVFLSYAPERASTC